MWYDIMVNMSPKMVRNFGQVSIWGGGGESEKGPKNGTI